MRMRTEFVSIDPIDLHPTADTQAARQPWQTPTMRMFDAKDAEADRGGIHFDGQGYMS